MSPFEKWVMLVQASTIIALMMTMRGLMTFNEDAWNVLISSRGTLIEAFVDLSLYECVMMDASLSVKRQEAVGDPEWKDIYSDEWREKFSLETCLSKLVTDPSMFELTTATADNMFKILIRMGRLKERVSGTLDEVMPVFGLKSPSVFADEYQNNQSNGTGSNPEAFRLSPLFEL
jgi:hypothetical protein